MGLCLAEDKQMTLGVCLAGSHPWSSTCWHVFQRLSACTPVRNIAVIQYTLLNNVVLLKLPLNSLHNTMLGMWI